MSNLITENYLRALSYNANVLLIGGAELSPDDLEDIDKSKYDLFVRINNHYVEQGFPVNVVYTSGSEAPQQELFSSVIVECRPLPDETESKWLELGTKNDNKYMRLDTNCYQQSNPFGGEHEFVNLLYKSLRTMPFTGMIAVEHLTRLPIKSLTLIGFNFYSRQGIMPATRDSHGIWEQAVWLYFKAMTDCRLRMSGKLFELIEKATEAKEYRENKRIGD